MTEISEAASLWGARHICPLRLRENEVHKVEIAGQPAALRLHRVGYQEAISIRSELWWTQALAEAGLPVPTPLAAADGQYLCRLATGRFASVVSWVQGSPLGEAGIPLAGSPRQKCDRHHAVGQLVARIHRATDLLHLPDWFARPAWGQADLVGEAPLWGRFWDHPQLGEEDRAVLSAARDWLAARLADSASPFGLIHADVLRENVFVNNGSLSLIDFDDSGYGYRWYDLGTVLSQDLYEPDYPELRSALIEGYASIAPVAADEVDAFTLARTLASVGWAASRLDPGSPIQKSHIARAVMMARRQIG